MSLHTCMSIKASLALCTLSRAITSFCALSSSILNVLTEVSDTLSLPLSSTMSIGDGPLDFSFASFNAFSRDSSSLFTVLLESAKQSCKCCSFSSHKVSFRCSSLANFSHLQKNKYHNTIEIGSHFYIFNNMCEFYDSITPQ